MKKTVLILVSVILIIGAFPLCSFAAEVILSQSVDPTGVLSTLSDLLVYPPMAVMVLPIILLVAFALINLLMSLIKTKFN